jgi:hypothetical protein
VVAFHDWDNRIEEPAGRRSNSADSSSATTHWSVTLQEERGAQPEQRGHLEEVEAAQVQYL